MKYLLLLLLFNVVNLNAQINNKRVTDWSSGFVRQPALQQYRLNKQERKYYFGENSQGLSSVDTGAALTKVGQWGWGPTYNLAAKGNYVYIANGYLLQVLDVTNPVIPKVVGELLTDNPIFTVTVSGNYVYTTTPFRIIDISNPANPVLVSTYILPSNVAPFSAVAVKGNYAYVGDNLGNIFVIDVSNPSSPKALSTASIPGDGVVSVAVKDTVLYANSIDNPGIYILNISNPDSIYKIGFGGNGNVGGLLTTAGRYLFNGAGIYMVMYDISNPSNPNYITELAVDKLGGFVDHISVVDTIAYATLASNRFAAVDIADTGNIHIISYLNNPYHAPGLEAAGEAVNFPYAYIATDDGVWTVNAANSDSMSSVSFFPTGGYINQMTVDSSYHAYLAELSAGLKIIDFSDPSSPKLIGYYLTNEEVIDVAIGGKYAYLDCDSDLQIIDVSNPASPKFISKISFKDSIATELEGYYSFLYLNGSTIYAARKSQKLFAVDVSDPSHPKIKSIDSLSGLPTGISLSNGYLYVAVQNNDIIMQNNSGVQIFNVSYPNAPMESGFLTVTGLGGITKYKNDLFVMGDDTTSKEYGLEKFDISYPAKPLFKYFVNIPGTFASPIDIKADKGYAYVNTELYTSGNTLYTINISNQDSGSIVYSVSLPSQHDDFNSIAMYNNIVLTGYLGVDLFKNNLITEVKTTNLLFNNYELFQNYPNPFNPTTIIKYQIPKSNFITLKVYDVLGNVVRTLVDGYRAQGRYSVSFNASNLASGIYFYRLGAGNFISTKKMLLLK